MVEFDSSGAALSASSCRKPEQKDVAALLEHLAETEAALLEERASKQAICDELLRVRSAAVEISGHDGGGSSDGRDNSSSWVAGGRTQGVVTATEGSGRSGGVDRVGREEEKPPWKNGLYKRQPYADNYVPDSFLEKLVTNGER